MVVIMDITLLHCSTHNKCVKSLNEGSSKWFEFVAAAALVVAPTSNQRYTKERSSINDMKTLNAHRSMNSRGDENNNELLID